jgi:hypothetical protein
MQARLRLPQRRLPDGAPTLNRSYVVPGFAVWYKVRVSLEERFARQARNESLFREVNEQIAKLGENAQAWSPDRTVEFMCECGEEGGCGQRVRVPLDVYYANTRRGA